MSTREEMILIKSRIKFGVVVLLATIFVYVTYDKLQRIDAERSLPMGVTEVEFTNWTKTREPDEIYDGEKKLNSYNTLAGLNKNISDSDVESIVDLYNVASTLKLRDIKYVYNAEGNKVGGNKVLRTIINPGTSIDLIEYQIDTLYGYLKSDKPINWKNDKTVEWNLYTEIDPEDKLSSIEWRMLSAKVNISQEQKRALQNHEAYALIGIPADNEYGFELIMPFNDIVSIFINKKITPINYQNKSIKKNYKLNEQNVTYKFNNCLNEPYHNQLSSHTCKYHVDTGTLLETKMESDIADKLSAGENTIDILIGNFIVRENEDIISHGFSKINLYIIEKPKIDISMKFYKYKNDEIIYFDDNYRPTKDEEVFIRIDIQNKSDKYALTNLDFSLKIADKGLIVNKKNAYYGGKCIKDKLRCYIDEDFSRECTIDDMKILQAGQKITLMSDSMTCLITQDNANRGYIAVTGGITVNYIRDDLKYIYAKDKNSMRVPVSEDFGVFKFICTIEDEENSQLSDESFIINVSSDNEFANFTIKPGQIYTLKNLSKSDCYNINLILPQDYEVVDTTTYSSSNQNSIILDKKYKEDYTANIHIKLKRKNNPYFYKNKQSKVNIRVE